MKWHKGKGVAGWTWAENKDVCADLRPLIARLETIGATAFDALDYVIVPVEQLQLVEKHS